MVDGAFHIPIWWYVSITVVYLSITVLGSVVLSMQYFTPVISKGTGKGIAISFDDGPVP